MILRLVFVAPLLTTFHFHMLFCLRDEGTGTRSWNGFRKQSLNDEVVVH